MKTGIIRDGNLLISAIRYDGDKNIFYDEEPCLIEYQCSREIYEELEDKIIVHYDIVEYDIVKVNTEISRLKNLLTDSDYKFLKFQEGELTAEQYNPTKFQRVKWRQDINDLETHLN